MRTDAMTLKWEEISADNLEEFLHEESFTYMFVNSYLYKPYLKRLHRYALVDTGHYNKIRGVIMIETAFMAGKERNVIHIAFRKALRGKTAIQMSKRWLREYLPRYIVLEGHVPKKWPQVAKFAQWFNFKPIAETAQHKIVELRV
jgi:hypothetical protein